MRGKSLASLLGLLFCLCSMSVLSHSEDKQANLQKMLLSDDAFQAILQFYQYDKDIPLDGDVVEKTDEKGIWLFQKQEPLPIHVFCKSMG